MSTESRSSTPPPRRRAARELAGSSSANSGLGRALTGILGDAAGQKPAQEVSALLGSGGPSRSPQVRRLVAELAVDTVSQAFDADGVMMARLGSDGTVDPLQTRLASTWSPADPIGFEVNGRLWNCLTERTSVQGQVPIGRLNVLFTRHKISPVVVATAVVRARPFDAEERDQLVTLMRSAAQAAEVSTALPPEITIRADVARRDEGSDPAGAEFTATVELDGPVPQRQGQGVGGQADRAIAVATVDWSGASMPVKFAGSTVVDADHVAMVVLGADGGAVFGLGVTQTNAMHGIVEATLSAIASTGAEVPGTSSR